MPHATPSRRHLLKSSLVWAGAAVWTTRNLRAVGFVSPNDRPRVRGHWDGQSLMSEGHRH